MITLSKSGNSVTFTFDENSGYLQNGTIDVPINSLALITDESDMATFRKSASNDIFISARYEEFGMSKAELEAWYKANMVDTITEEEIQDMIDTSTANYFDNAVYDSGTTRINFYHGNTVKASIDASQFVIDGMIDDVRIETISGVTYLVIDFNTASGKEDIQIPLTDIFDPSNYYTKQEVDASLSGKQATLVSGTNIKTINNESLLGSGNIDIQGGGKAIEAGRGISITTGATADTVSFNLPISAGTSVNSIAEGENTQAVGYNSHAEGYNTRAGGHYSHTEGLSTSANTIANHAEGYNTLAKGAKSHVEGSNTIANNESEHASGQFNVSSSASTTFGDSGNTLFSVGNGTADNARHNAFEIRQNGDIYCNNGTSDVKLQDYIQFKIVQITQAAYDALVTKDSSTIYIIVN